MKHGLNTKFHAAFILVIAAYSLESAAESMQYRWENERGEAVYSDRPPPTGVEYQYVDTHPGLNWEDPDSASPDSRVNTGDIENKIEPGVNSE